MKSKELTPAQSRYLKERSQIRDQIDRIRAAPPPAGTVTFSRYSDPNNFGGYLPAPSGRYVVSFEGAGPLAQPGQHISCPTCLGHPPIPPGKICQGCLEIVNEDGRAMKLQGGYLRLSSSRPALKPPAQHSVHIERTPQKRLPAGRKLLK